MAINIISGIYKIYDSYINVWKVAVVFFRYCCFCDGPFLLVVFRPSYLYQACIPYKI